MRALTFTVLCAVASVSPLAGQSEEEEAVMTVVRHLFDAMRAADSAAVRSVFHPEARLVATGERNGEPTVRIVSAEGFIEAVGGAQQTWDERIWDSEVRVDGNLATVWTQYDFRAGDRFSHCGVDSFQLVKTSDGWKIVSIADTRRTEGCESPPDP